MISWKVSLENKKYTIIEALNANEAMQIAKEKTGKNVLFVNPIYPKLNMENSDKIELCRNAEEKIKYREMCNEIDLINAIIHNDYVLVEEIIDEIEYIEKAKIIIKNIKYRTKNEILNNAKSDL